MAGELSPAWLIVVQTLLLVAAAPLLTGWVKWVKCRLQNRRGPAPLQPYRDLKRLIGKQPIVAEGASPLFRGVPYVVFAALMMAAAAVPFVALDLAGPGIADMIVLVGLMALARFFLALGGMDIGTAFGGMGASREMSLSAFAEPALLMAIFTLAFSAHSTNLSAAMGFVLDQGLVLRPSYLFALLGLVLVAIAETGRVPVDNPATHLELTMVHEAMVLEYSGRHLALIEWAAQIKLTLFAVLIANLFLPWGIALDGSFGALAVAAAAIALKLAVLGAALAVAEMRIAKMRLFRVPLFLNFALLLALLGVLSHVILEGGA